MSLAAGFVAPAFGRAFDGVLADAVFARVLFSAFGSVLEPALGFAVLVLAMAVPPVATELVDRALKQCDNYTLLSI